MNAAWLDQAGRMPARQLHLLGAGVLLVATAALWFYGLRAPLAELRMVRAEQARLESGGMDARLLAARLAAVDGETATLTRRLGAASTGRATGELVELAGAIGQLAAAHHVTLGAVTPAPEEKALVFNQAGFDVDASGSYAALLAWMAAIERARPNLSIASFEMRSAKTAGQVDIKIRIAAFRPLEKTP